MGDTRLGKFHTAPQRTQPTLSKRHYKWFARFIHFSPHPPSTQTAWNTPVYYYPTTALVDYTCTAMPQDLLPLLLLSYLGYTHSKIPRRERKPALKRITEILSAETKQKRGLVVAGSRRPSVAAPHHFAEYCDRLCRFSRFRPPRGVVLYNYRAVRRQVPRDLHFIPGGRVDAAQHQRLPVLFPAHVGERRGCWRRGWGGVGGRRVWSGLPPDEKVLVLGVAGVAVDDQVEAGGVVVYEMHHRRGLHPRCLRRMNKLRLIDMERIGRGAGRRGGISKM